MKVLLVIINEELHTSMTPPDSVSTLLLVKVLLVILNEEFKYMFRTPVPRKPAAGPFPAGSEREGPLYHAQWRWYRVDTGAHRRDATLSRIPPFG